VYAATAGAGIYVRNLSAGTWHPFGAVFEPFQASNVNSLAVGGTRLLAMAGSNGNVFFRDPGDAEWAVSNLDNLGLHPGLGPMTAVWTGFGWVVGSNLGIFHSVAGQEPWTRFNPGLGPLNWTAFATQGHHVFAAFVTSLVAVMAESGDDGATWHSTDTFPAVFVKSLVISGNTLYAARGDGLWQRANDTASLPPAGEAGRARFALAGPQPFGDRTGLRFELPQAGSASIEIFDALGRRAAEPITGWWSPGPHQVTVDARNLSPGVYTALLSAGDVRDVVRLVHLR